jgi:hypothetical protein
MAQDGFTMKSDKVLDADINRATTFEELQMLLHNAVERSPELGITRDPISGQFVAREIETTAAADKAAADAAPRTFKKTETIGGHAFDFIANSAEALQLQIDSAKAVAGALTADQAVTSRSVRAKAQAEREREIYDRTQLDQQFKLGQLTTAEYLDRTNAIGEYLASQGVDVAKLSQEQANESWAAATETFLNSAAGADWPGGTKNRALLGDKLAALGLVDAEDKVAALAQAYETLKAAGTLFDGDYSQKQVEAMTAQATPQEILQAWKESVQKDVNCGDATQANETFIKTFGGSSGIFNQ